VSNFWFLKDLQRLVEERKAIETLEDNTQWLKGTNWTFDTGKLAVEAIIHAHSYDYAVKMVYPALFPEIPPEVYPMNSQENWSVHQYLHGALCLEWRPDTWHPGVTGADVLESAYTLLSTENPHGTGEQNVVPIQHELSQGQTLRASYIRAYVSQEVPAYFADLPVLSMGSIDCWMRWQSRSFLVLLQGLQPANGYPEWSDGSIPKALGDTPKKGIFCKTQHNSENLKRIKTLHDLETILEQSGYSANLLTGIDSTWPEYTAKGLFFVLLTDAKDQLHCFLKISSDEEVLSAISLVQSAHTITNPRIPKELKPLSGKSVSIVGLGSVGSKMALSLARTGIGKFYLVDEDVFLPDNICRHSLDWRNVGEHKVYAVADVVSCISAVAEVDVGTLNLGGQESSLALDSVLKRLSQCDLIIDATANARVFNLLASVAKNYSKPLVWGEVFAGGIGGIIARSRPGLDPDPQGMRASLYEFFSVQDAPLPTTLAEPYGMESEEGLILQASDAEVSIIASHLTHLAIDTVLLKDPSSFPYSMYVLGLQRGWIFDAPFHTIPIDTGNAVAKEESPNTSSDVVNQGIDFLNGLLEQTRNEDPPS
jgi:sulfur-carrier protein adenylyltransferase/sulfurtransferase